ncbi:DeoR/GlpR family DNA-binding transcription regulator [Roseovarius nubinhibens]|uniref:DeoR/GlpR family DNA-binding transcription regulator n=1 Tax=Roseovarius nubinhibens TaxID=314263 RepID=UPI001C089F34|nr:DeoR/GlpR family DNA-binding transcription regulator [Roseovarius nubinhibens]
MQRRQSKKERRQTRILDALKHNPAKRVNELAEELEVSPETIRRDLSELDAEGRIRRTYGGAVRTSPLEPALADRMKLHVQAREQIAACAVDALHDVENLYIGGGATTLHFARALRQVERSLTILTASFEIAIELAANPLFKVISVPGRVELQEGLVHGPDTLRFIADYHVQAAIIGASAIDEVGVSEAHPSAADVYAAMIQQAEHTYVVADRSKIGHKSLKRILNWNERTTLVTDCELSRDMHQSFEAAGANLAVADHQRRP